MTRFLFYVRGSRPSAVRHWSKPYLTAAVARSQAARFTSYAHDHGTDWTVRIFALDDDALSATAASAFTLTEVPA